MAWCLGSTAKYSSSKFYYITHTVRFLTTLTSTNQCSKCALVGCSNNSARTCTAAHRLSPATVPPSPHKASQFCGPHQPFLTLILTVSIRVHLSSLPLTVSEWRVLTLCSHSTHKSRVHLYASIHAISHRRSPRQQHV